MKGPPERILQAVQESNNALFLNNNNNNNNNNSRRQSSSSSRSGSGSASLHEVQRWEEERRRHAAVVQGIEARGLSAVTVATRPQATGRWELMGVLGMQCLIPAETKQCVRRLRGLGVDCKLMTEEPVSAAKALANGAGVGSRIHGPAILDVPDSPFYSSSDIVRDADGFADVHMAHQANVVALLRTPSSPSDNDGNNSSNSSSISSSSSSSNTSNASNGNTVGVMCGTSQHPDSFLQLGGDVQIAVEGTNEVLTRGADIVLPGPSLSPLVECVRQARGHAALLSSAWIFSLWVGCYVATSCVAAAVGLVLVLNGHLAGESGEDWGLHVAAVGASLDRWGAIVLTVLAITKGLMEIAVVTSAPPNHRHGTATSSGDGDDNVNCRDSDGGCGGGSGGGGRRGPRHGASFKRVVLRGAGIGFTTAMWGAAFATMLVTMTVWQRAAPTTFSTLPNGGGSSGSGSSSGGGLGGGGGSGSEAVHSPSTPVDAPVAARPVAMTVLEVFLPSALGFHPFFPAPFVPLGVAGVKNNDPTGAAGAAGAPGAAGLSNTDTPAAGLTVDYDQILAAIALQFATAGSVSGWMAAGPRAWRPALLGLLVTAVFAAAALFLEDIRIATSPSSSPSSSPPSSSLPPSSSPGAELGAGLGVKFTVVTVAYGFLTTLVSWVMPRLCRCVLRGVRRVCGRYCRCSRCCRCCHRGGDGESGGGGASYSAYSEYSASSYSFKGSY